MSHDPHELLLEALKEVDGVFFKGMDLYAEKLANRFFEPGYRGYYHNLLVKMDYDLFSQMERNPNIPKRNYSEFLQEVIEVINWGDIAVSQEELLFFLEFITEIFYGLFMKVFLREWDQEKTLVAVNKRSTWLKRGILK